MMLGGKASSSARYGLIASASTQTSSGQLTFTWGTGASKPLNGDTAVIITSWRDTTAGLHDTISWASGFALGGFSSDGNDAGTYPGHRIDQKVCTGSESGSFSTTGLPADVSCAVYLLFRGVSVPGYARRSTQTGNTLNSPAILDAPYYTRSGDYVIGAGLHFLAPANTSTPTATSELTAYIEAGQTGSSMAVAVWAPSNTGSDTMYDPAAFGVSGYVSQPNTTLTIPLLAP